MILQYYLIAKALPLAYPVNITVRERAYETTCCCKLLLSVFFVLNKGGKSGLHWGHDLNWSIIITMRKMDISQTSLGIYTWDIYSSEIYNVLYLDFLYSSSIYSLWNTSLKLFSNSDCDQDESFFSKIIFAPAISCNLQLFCGQQTWKKT